MTKLCSNRLFKYSTIPQSLNFYNIFISYYLAIFVHELKRPLTYLSCSNAMFEQNICFVLITQLEFHWKFSYYTAVNFVIIVKIHSKLLSWPLHSINVFITKETK